MSTTSISEALEKISNAIAADPAKARAKAAPATARLLEGLRCEITGPEGEIIFTDMPRAVGGAASGAAPGWLLRGAIASCTTTVIAMRAASLGVHLKTLEVTVESESDHRGMLGLDERVSAAFTALHVRIKIGGDSLPPDELRALAQWGNAHSPVACTVRKSPVMAVEVEIV